MRVFWTIVYAGDTRIAIPSPLVGVHCMNHVRIIVAVAVAVAIVCLCGASSLHAQHWPRFRGPNGSGVGQGQIPAPWAEKNIAWKIQLPGSGHGSPVVWGDRIFLQVAQLKGSDANVAQPKAQPNNAKGKRKKPRGAIGKPGEQMVLCINARDGKTLWSVAWPFKSYKTHRNNSFASSTPAVDADRVYTLWTHDGANVDLIALDHNGKAQWRVKIGTFKGGHGHGMSPIVYKNMVIVGHDNDGDSFLLAFDVQTGKPLWKIARKSKRTTYSTPCVFEHKNKAQLIFTNWTHGMTGIEPKTGTVLWDKDVFGHPHVERAIASPIVFGDTVIATCGFTTLDKHCVVLRPGEHSKGDAPEVWRTKREVPHIPSPIVVDGKLFLWSDRGIVSCFDPTTGKAIWAERGGRGGFYSSPVSDGTRVFNISDDGQVFAVDAAEKFNAVDVFNLNEQVRATPAIAHGNMYVRTFGHLLCVTGNASAQ